MAPRLSNDARRLAWNGRNLARLGCRAARSLVNQKHGDSTILLRHALEAEAEEGRGSGVATPLPRATKPQNVARMERIWKTELSW